VRPCNSVTLGADSKRAQFDLASEQIGYAAPASRDTAPRHAIDPGDRVESTPPICCCEAGSATELLSSTRACVASATNSQSTCGRARDAPQNDRLGDIARWDQPLLGRRSIL